MATNRYEYDSVTATGQTPPGRRRLRSAWVLVIAAAMLLFVGVPLVQLWPAAYLSAGICLTGENVKFTSIYRARDAGREGHFMEVSRISAADCELLKKKQLARSSYPMWSPGAAMDGQSQENWQLAVDSIGDLRTAIHRAARGGAKDIAPEDIHSMDDVRQLGGVLVSQPGTLVAGHHDDGAGNYTLYILNLERGILVVITLVA
jgi:hypothetical protein